MIDLKKLLRQIKERLPKDEYKHETISKDQLDAGWTCSKTCLAMAVGNPTNSNPASLTIRDSHGEVVVSVANSPGLYYLRAWFIAEKGQIYKLDYQSGLTRNLSRLNVVCLIPSGGVFSKSVLRRSSL